MNTLQEIQNKIKIYSEDWDFKSLETLYKEGSIFKEIRNEYVLYLYKSGQTRKLLNFLKNTQDINLEELGVQNLEENLLNKNYEKLSLDFQINEKLNTQIKQKSLSVSFVYENFSLLHSHLAQCFFVKNALWYFVKKEPTIQKLFFEYPFLQRYKFYEFIVLNEYTKGGKSALDLYYQKVSDLRTKINDGWEKGKIAILFYGSLRGSWKKQLQENIKKLANPLNADVFIHTWDELALFPSIQTGWINWCARMLTSEVASKAPKEIADKNEFMRYFPNVYDKFSKEYSVDVKGDFIKFAKNNPCIKSFKLKNPHFLFQRFIGGEYLFYHCYKGFELIKSYEKVKNFSYNTILSLRIDSKCSDTTFLNDIDQLRTNHIIELLKSKGAGNAVGPRDLMFKYANLYRFYNHTKDFCKKHNTGVENNHLLYVYYMKLQGIRVENIEAFPHYRTKSLAKMKIPNIQTELKKDLYFLEKNKLLKQETIKICKDFFKTLYDSYEIVPKNAHSYYRADFRNLIDNKNRRATMRILNSIEKELGTLLVQAVKSPFSFIKLPFNLLQVANLYLQKKKAYEKELKFDLNVKLPPLQTYDDYEEALKIKEHLSYKLGSALIKRNKEASNNVFKFALTGGGGFDFFIQRSA